MNKLERKKQDYAWRDKAISFKVLQLVIEGEKVYTSVLVDPEWFDEDPGPTFYIDAVPNMYYLVSTTIHMYVRVYNIKNNWNYIFFFFFTFLFKKDHLKTNFSISRVAF